jgi:hypothetical protein
VDGFAKTDPVDEPTVDLPTVTAAGADSLPEPIKSWPRIADYWPDAPHRMSPAADFNPGDEPAVPAGGAPTYPQDPAPTRIISPPPPPRRPRLRLVVSVLGALVFLGGSVFALTRLVAGPDEPERAVPAAPATAPAQNGAIGAQSEPSPPVSVAPAPSTSPTSAPAEDDAGLPFKSGTFELASSVIELNLTVADLGDEPFRVSTPKDSGLSPRTTVDDDTVKLVAKAEDKGTGRLDVRLNERIAWSLRMSGGVRNGRFALAGADVRRIDLVGGAAKLDMVLPSRDEISIKMSGGVNQWTITTTREVPVRALLRKGGGEVVLNGNRVRGVNKGTTLLDKVDGNDDGGLKIDAVEGVGTLTVTPAENAA